MSGPRLLSAEKYFYISTFLTFLLYLDGSSTRHSRQFALLICDNLPCFEAKTLHKYKLVFLVQKNYLEIIVITRILFVSNEKADPHYNVDQNENVMQSRQQVPGDRNTLGEGCEAQNVNDNLKLTLRRYIG